MICEIAVTGITWDFEPTIIAVNEQMWYPQAVQDFRDKLSLRRGQKRSVYEVLAYDVLDVSPSTDEIDGGVFNSDRKHWAIGCSNFVYSFVWKVEHGKESSSVVGAKCAMYPYYFDCYGRRNLRWIGSTSLNIDEIKKAGDQFLHFT